MSMIGRGGANVAEIEETFTAHNNDIENLGNEVTQQSQDLTDLSVTVAGHGQAINGLGDAVITQDSEIETLQSEVQALQQNQSGQSGSHMMTYPTTFPSWAYFELDYGDGNYSVKLDLAGGTFRFTNQGSNGSYLSCEYSYRNTTSGTGGMSTGSSTHRVQRWTFGVGTQIDALDMTTYDIHRVKFYVSAIGGTTDPVLMLDISILRHDSGNITVINDWKVIEV